MIVLHTGIPGHGKTLFSLWHVRKWAESENRKVYYHGIPDLQIPDWEELADPKEWASVPPKSIVLIDEAQKVFPRRSSNGAVPHHVSAFETHRHLGIDVVLITQHPSLIDRHIHPLADKHRHVIRAFGSKYATVHEWPQVMPQCEKPGSRKDSVKTQFPYPKEVFTWYKSAEAHTYKARVPGKVWFGLALPLLLAVAVWYVYDWARQRIDKPSQAVETGASPGAPGVGVGQGGHPRKGGEKKQTLAEWVEDQTPRVPGLPHTAPVYDQVVQPQEAPYPAACLSMASRGCRCYTQQGTLLQIDPALCAQIVANGFYVAWKVPNTAISSGVAGPVRPGAVRVEQPMRSASSVATIASSDAGQM